MDLKDCKADFKDTLILDSDVDFTKLHKGELKFNQRVLQTIEFPTYYGYPNIFQRLL